MSTNPWLTIDRSAAPFVVGSDIERLQVYSASRRGKSANHQLNLTVVPEPWCGPLLAAAVVVLSGNPHWDERDESLPEVAYERMWENLSGERSMFWLDPDLLGTTGSEWYRTRLLKNVLEHCEPQAVAARVALVDFIGYRSRQWDHSLRLPSQEFTVQAVREVMRRGGVIVLSRGRAPWFSLIPELVNYRHLFINSSPQQVRLSPNNTSPEGFDAIVTAMQQ